ncbi:MAG: hypothetical protein WCP89_02065, partial [archaeon]
LEESKVYKLDRLGIPLVEIATGPHMHTPEQIKEAALKIGEILRAAKVRRGIGTIRQDVNISIKGSERVEIKGFQDPKMMIETVDNEIKRQEVCLKNKSCNKEVRKSLPDGTSEFLRPMPGSARMYPETDVPLLKISRDMINEAKNTLPKLTSENKSYLKEFGLNDELVTLLLQNNRLSDFKSIIEYGIENANLVAKSLTLFQKEISVREKKSLSEVSEKLSIDIIEKVLEEVEKGNISENDVRTILVKVVRGENLIEAMKKESVDLKGEIERLMKEKPGLSEGAYMGLVMAKFKGKVSGKDVADELKKISGK